MGIGAFLVKGEEAQSLKRGHNDGGTESPAPRPSGKQKEADKDGIRRFFPRTSSNDQDDEPVSHSATWATGGSNTSHSQGGEPANAVVWKQPDGEGQMHGTIDAYICGRCRTSLMDADEFQCHQDEHFARDLQEEERGSRTFAGQSPSATATPLSNKGAAASSTRPTKRKKTEAGQTKLKFA